MSIKPRGNNRLSPEYVLLGFLYRSPCHGYELHQRLMNEFGNIWHASQSQTYNILKRLEAQGIVQATFIEQVKLPSRQQLRLTPLGAERFEAWLAQPTKPSVHALRVEFITRLYFTRQYYPERIKPMVDDQMEVVKAGLAELDEQLAKISDPLSVEWLAVQLRQELLSSVVRWLDKCYQVSFVKPGGECGDA